MPSYADYSTPGRRAGLAVIATSGFLSAISTLALLIYFLYCHFQTQYRGLSSPLTRGVNKFRTSSLGKFLVFLIICDFLQGSAFATNYYWTVVGYMDESAPCVFQGAVSQVGDLGAALWSNVIAFQTFCLLFLQRKPPRGTETLVTIVVWTALIVLPILGPTVLQNEATDGPFWGLSGAWCWIGNGYQTSRLLFLYVWVFLNLLCCFIIYALIYLKFAGIVEYEPDRWWKTVWFLRRPKSGINSSAWHLAIATTSSKSGTDDMHVPEPGHVSKHAVRVARRLMWYPIVYAVVTAPVAVCRLGVLSGWTPPFWLFAFAGTLFSASGLSNTLLFLFTRHAFIQRTLHAPVSNITLTHHILPEDPETPSSGLPLRPTKAQISSPLSSVFSLDGKVDPFKSPMASQEGRTIPLTVNREMLSPMWNPRDRTGGDSGRLSPHTPSFNYYSYQYRQPRSPEQALSPLTAALSPPRTGAL